MKKLAVCEVFFQLFQGLSENFQNGYMNLLEIRDIYLKKWSGEYYGIFIILCGWFCYYFDFISSVFW